MTEQHFSAKSGRINYVEDGSGARPVVLLHGLTLNGQSMADIGAALGRIARTYACDLPGHGKSEWREHRYRISDYADDLAPFVADVSGSGSVLVGFSTGALVALAVAARLRELVAGVVAIDPPLIARDSDFEALRYSDAYGWIHWVNDLNAGRLTPAQAMVRFIELQPGAGEAEAREAMGIVSAVDPRATELVVAGGTLEDLDLGETLQSIACPTLLLAGEVALGGLVRDQDVEFFSANTPHRHVVRIFGGGHGIILDEPAEAVRTEIVNFLASLDPPPVWDALSALRG